MFGLVSRWQCAILAPNAGRRPVVQFRAAIWAPLFAGLGWGFGAAIERLLGRIRNVEHWLFIALIAAGIALWLFHRLRAGRRG